MRVKTQILLIGDIEVKVTQKRVKNVHLSVYPPDGHVTLVAPSGTRLEVMRAYALSKLHWIKQQQRNLAAQARETPRTFVERESHYLWGQRYLMTIEYKEEKPQITLDHKRMMIQVRPGTDEDKRAQIMHEWHKGLLHQTIPLLIKKWEAPLKVSVNHYFLQRMKTRWGSCKHELKHIRLNTELVKKPKHLLEYVVVHEMLHMIEPSHNEHFIELLNQHYPAWQHARAELNELPLSAQEWNE